MKAIPTLKGLTRTNTHIDQQAIHAFVDTLQVSDKLKAMLKTITPANYIGEDYKDE